MSNLIPSINPSKNVNASSQSPSSFQSQTNLSHGSEHHPQRRSGGSSSFGAGSASRATASSPRNGQSLRKQHKTPKRSRFADDDAAAESVSLICCNHFLFHSMTHISCFIGGYEVCQQPKGSDFYNPSHDILSTATATIQHTA